MHNYFHIGQLLFFGLIISHTLVGQQATLVEAVQNVQVKGDTYEQSFSYNTDNPCLLTFTIFDTDKGEETIYEVNATDLNEYKIRFDTQGKAVQVEAETRGSRDLVRVLEDGEVNGYEDGFEIYATGIENARDLVNALKEVVKTCNEQNNQILVNGKASPSLNEALLFLESEIRELKVGSQSYDQSFSYQNDQSTLITYSWQDLSEGGSRKYVANVADFNEQSVSFNTKGEHVWLTMETQGGRDLVQTYEDGELDDYENEIEIMAANIEQARVLEMALKAVIAAAERQESSFIPGNSAPDQSTTVQYLSEQIGTVTLSKAIYEQTFSYDAAAKQVRFDMTELSKAEKNSYLFNPADITANTINFDTRGSEVLIQLETQGKRDLIQVLENDIVDGYDDEIILRASGIEEARQWCAALKRLVSLASENQQDMFHASLGNTPNQTLTIQFLHEYIQSVEHGEDRYQQTFTSTPTNQCLVSYTLIDESKGEEEIYEWNMTDINARPIAFDTKGKTVLVILATIGERDLVKVIEDGEVDGYENEIEIQAKNIEEARALVAAFKHLASICQK